MQTCFTWLHVPWTRTHYDGGTWRVSGNGNGEASQSAGDAKLGQLLLRLWDGGFLQWGMENVVLHLSPRSRGRWEGPAFTSVFGGQCANGGDNGGRKDTHQPLSEDLMHNKTSPTLSCMAKMPRFLKGA